MVAHLNSLCSVSGIVISKQILKLVISWWLPEMYSPKPPPPLPVFIVNSVWRIGTKGKVMLPAVSNLPNSAPVWCSRKLDWIVQDTRFSMGSQRPKFGNPSRLIGLLRRKLWFPSRCHSLRTTSVQIPPSPFLPSRIWLLTFLLKGVILLFSVPTMQKANKQSVSPAWKAEAG